MRTAIALSLVMLTGCGPVAERTLIEQFFAASRLRDLTALSKFSTVVFEPNRDGIVTSFEITQVSAQKSGTEVLLSASVKRPDGRIVRKNFLVTIEGGLVTAISERPASPSTPRS